MLVELNDDFFEDVGRQIREYLAQQGGGSRMIGSALHDLTRPRTAGHAPQELGHGLSRLVQRIVTDHVAKSKPPLPEGRRWPEVNDSDAEDDKRWAKYITWRILQECLVPLAVELVEDEQAARAGTTIP